MKEKVRPAAIQKAYLDPAALADRWDIPKQNLATMRYHGNGPVYTKIGGRIRYSLQDVLDYEQSQRFSRTDTRVGGN